ncbi:MAG: FKBP-type peptidyl-prolyl cis-trans isomerase [Flavobacteriales bacterium]
MDSSDYRTKLFKFTVGVGQVIKDWDRFLRDLKKGLEAYIIIPPQ